MKVVAISDTHGLKFPMPDADLLIHCGDLSSLGRIEEVAKVAARLRGHRYPAAVIVPGNHDFCFQRIPDAAKSVFAYGNYQVLIDDLWEYQGLSIYGSPWTPIFMNWAFIKGEERLRETFAKIPKKLDILITHGPAYGILDNDQGSVALREAIDAREIRYHFFGHIHERGGQSMERSPGQWSYNVAVLDLAYEMVREPLILEIEKRGG